MTRHVFQEIGRFKAIWDDDAEEVAIKDKSGTELGRWTEDGTLSDVSDIAETYRDLTADEFRFLIDVFFSVENWVSFSNDDMRRYGEIKVSF